MLKHYIANFEREVWQRIEYFFRILSRSKIHSLSDCTRTVTLLLDPQFIWISPWLLWKAISVETLYSEFLSAKFDSVSSTFFLYTLDQKFFPSQTVLGQWRTSPDPQFIWLSRWLVWKAIYVETVYSKFLRAKFDNVSSTFFVYHLGQKLFSSQTVLGQWHSSLDPQFIWINPWLGWEAIYVKTLYNEFLSAKFDSVSSTFFRIHPRSKILSLSDCSRTVTLLLRPSNHLNKSLTGLKSNLCWNTI